MHYTNYFKVYFSENIKRLLTNKQPLTQGAQWKLTQQENVCTHWKESSRSASVFQRILLRVDAVLAEEEQQKVVEENKEKDEEQRKEVVETSLREWPL